MRFELLSSSERYFAETRKEQSCIAVELNGKTFRIVLAGTEAPNHLRALINDKLVSVTIEEETQSSITLTIDGEKMVFERPLSKLDKVNAMVSEENETLKSPMPGRILSLMVKRGQKIQAGDSLVIIESMKMESVLIADRDAIVKATPVKQGDAIHRGQTIIVYEKEISER